MISAVKTSLGYLGISISFFTLGALISPDASPADSRPFVAAMPSPRLTLPAAEPRNSPHTANKDFAHRFKLLCNPLNWVSLADVLREWAEQDPTAAIEAWTKASIPWNQAGESPRNATLALLLEGWVQKSPKDALSWIQESAPKGVILTDACIRAFLQYDRALALKCFESKCGSSTRANALATSLVLDLGSDEDTFRKNLRNELIKNRDVELIQNLTRALAQGTEEDRGKLYEALHSIGKDLPRGIIPHTIIQSLVVERPAMAFDLAFNFARGQNGEEMRDNSLKFIQKGISQSYTEGRTPSYLTAFSSWLNADFDGARNFVTQLEDADESRILIEAAPALMLKYGVENVNKAFAVTGDSSGNAISIFTAELFNTRGLKDATDFASKLENPALRQKVIEALDGFARTKKGSSGKTE